MTRISSWANWVARDKEGSLWGFEDKPVATRSGRWQVNGLGSNNFAKAYETDSEFIDVSWDDDEPTRVESKAEKLNERWEKFGNDSESKTEVSNELTKEAVNHPAHYQGNKFEVIDIIEDYNLNFHLGNVVKYVLRADKKDNRVEDLRKAQFYINRELERDSDD